MRRCWGLAAVAAAVIAAPAAATVSLGRAPALVLRSGCADVTVPAGRNAGVVAGCGGSATDVDLMVVDPADPSRRSATTSFSILVDADSRAMVTAYDASGRLLGVADRSEAGPNGERLSLAGLGDIARIHISGRGPVAYEDLRIAEPEAGGHLPEPATWALLIAGFGLTAGAVRRRIRMSEARFTERVRRIAEGGAA